MIENIAELQISTHFLPAIFNGDVTGLSDEDEAVLAEWYDNNPEFLNATFELIDDSENEFYLCDITNRMSNVATLSVWR